MGRSTHTIKPSKGITMAYITKEQVQEKRHLISALCKKYNVSATVSGANSSTLTVTVRKGTIDFLGNYVDTAGNDWLNCQQQKDNALFYKKRGYMTVNHYCIEKQLSGIALDFMLELLAIMKIGHFDHSDNVTDYFYCAWYNGISVGTGNKPYIFTA